MSELFEAFQFVAMAWVGSLIICLTYMMVVNWLNKPNKTEK